MKPLIAIGLGTRDRPEMLKQALASLERLIQPNGVEVLLLVCDNGSRVNSDRMIADFTKRIPFQTILLREDSIGIVYMRNRILNEAIKQNASYLAYFDDDEKVENNWLVNLYEAGIKYSADVVQGKVVQQFPEVPNLELVKKFFPGNFSKRTGHELNDAYTNNVVFDLSLVKTYQIWFNERFNLIGGSDSYFFNELKERGARIVFCEEAVVTEVIPESRATLEWVLSRFYRNGYVKYMMDLERFGRLKALLKGIGYVWRSLRSCYFSGFKKRPMNEIEMQKKKRCLRAKGVLHAMFGLTFSEYETIHGN